MKITNLNSSAVIVEANGVKILSDPWLVDGEHYGSWAIYPPMPFDANDYNDIDYIYISHIHHDHCSLKTLALLNKAIPVIIHRYEVQFMKNNLERLGFSVIELNHNERTHLKNGVYINILAADNCNPEICHRYYGCGIVESKYGSTQIDTLAVIDNGIYTCVNVNDCPYDLSVLTVDLINEQYPVIDFALIGYLGAGPYPQCFSSLNETEKKIAAAGKQKQFLQYNKNYLLKFKPRYYMPFAGTYLLSGKLAQLNENRGNPDIETAKAWFEGQPEIDHLNTRCVLLNQKASFDIETQSSSQVYVPIDHNDKQRFINEVLAHRKLDYEHDPMPTLEQFQLVLPQAYARMNAKRNTLDFSSNTIVLMPLVENKIAMLTMNDNGYSLIEPHEIDSIETYVSITIDPRLLIKILNGPRYAHYNNAEGGSHIVFHRKPKNSFERPIYYCMNFFHA